MLTYGRVLDILTAAGLCPRTYEGCLSVRLGSKQEMAALVRRCSSLDEAATLIETASFDGIGGMTQMYWPTLRSPTPEEPDNRSLP